MARKAGAREDFRYSNAIKRADMVGDDANLRDHLRDPQAKARGNHMPFSGFAIAKGNSAKRRELAKSRSTDPSALNSGIHSHKWETRRCDAPSLPTLGLPREA